MGQHLAWSMHLGICPHAAGICSHAMLVIHTLLVIDAFPPLKHSCPALGMQHDRSAVRSSRSLSNWEIPHPLGRLLRIPTQFQKQFPDHPCVVESPWTIHFQQCSSESRQVTEELVESWTDRSAPASALEDKCFES